MISLFSIFSTEWIDIRSGKATQRKGCFTRRTLAEISDVLARHPQVNGHIRSSGDGRYHFSRSIPQSLRQGLRNILVSR